MGREMTGYILKALLNIQHSENNFKAVLNFCLKSRKGGRKGLPVTPVRHFASLTLK